MRPHGLRDLAVYAKGPLPEPPATVTPPAWAMNMDGNDLYGDCVLAAAANSIGLADALVTQIVPIPDADQVITEYQALTGCAVAGDPHDTGLVEADVLQRWFTTGLFNGDKNAGYAPVNPTDTTLLEQTVAFYGFAYCGFQLQAAMEDQFRTGVALDWVPGSPTVGGHAMLIVGYTGTNWLLYTWEKIVLATARFVTKCCDEAWAVLSEPVVEAGHGPWGTLDLNALRADLRQL